MDNRTSPMTGQHIHHRRSRSDDETDTETPDGGTALPRPACSTRCALAWMARGYRYSGAWVGLLSVLAILGATVNLWQIASKYAQSIKISHAGPVVEVEVLPVPTVPPPRRRVAVCFFGLTRSLRWTLPSVERRLLGVLREAGMDVEVFVHTYDLVEVNNERAGEREVEYKTFSRDFNALNPTRSLVTNQDDFDKAWPNPLEMTRFRWNYPEKLAAGVIRNVFRAYMSMATVWGLMIQYSSELDFEYDAVVLARPDVWFHVDTDLPRRTFPLPERTVFIPSFETNLKKGGRKNDRFSYGSVTAMRVVMHRVATFVDANADRYWGEIDSEWVMGHHLETHNISVATMEFPVTRVRLTGDIPFFDHVRVKAMCGSGKDPMACEMIRLGFRFPVEGSNNSSALDGAAGGG